MEKNGYAWKGAWNDLDTPPISIEPQIAIDISIKATVRE